MMLPRRAFLSHLASSALAVVGLPWLARPNSSSMRPESAAVPRRRFASDDLPPELFPGKLYAPDDLVITTEAGEWLEQVRAQYGYPDGARPL